MARAGDDVSETSDQRPDTEAVLATLKDFQRATVEYVFQRMYLDERPSRRFLVADEVGLGKTLVARGLVAKIVDHLWDEVDRIDVVYICANTDIARQNIRRLNIDDDREVALASRLTLLPVTLHRMHENKVNFIALTPGTSFNLRSSEGIMDERALMYHLLRDEWGFGDEDGPFRALQGWVSDSEWWPGHVRRFGDRHEVEASLKRAFLDALAQDDEGRRARGESTLREEFADVAGRLASRGDTVKCVTDKRARVVGELRAQLRDHVHLGARARSGDPR